MEEITEILDLEERLSKMKISIVTKYHLNTLGKTKGIQEISAIYFRSSLFSMEEYDKSDMVIYVDKIGVRCLKNRYNNEHTNIYMTHIGFDEWTY